jgi:NADH-quinone oxidoreductase subunit J
MPLFFWIIIYLLLICAFAIIFSRGPVVSLLSLMMVFIVTGIWLIIFGLDFFGLIIITVYVGGIIVFFLFVLLMIPSASERKNLSSIDAIIYIIVIFSLVYFFLDYSGILSAVSNPIYSNLFVFICFHNIKDSIFLIAALLYTFYNLYVICAALILYFAMIGTLAILSENYHFFKQI